MLELQKLDTALDQALVALERLPERQRHNDVTTNLARLRARRDDIRSEQVKLESELAAIEATSAEVDAHRARLERQMKTIIAPREAEALQHELAVLAAQRSDLDDRGLLLLESSSEADRDIERLAGEEGIASTEEHIARADLAEAVSKSEAVIRSLRQQRDSLATTFSTVDLVKYDAMRVSFGGVAIAVIEHGMCGGCHMDLSVAELDAIKRRPADDTVECPNCNRLLAR